MARWLGGSVARWLGGSVARWLGGSVARWLGGSVARWLGGSVASVAAINSTVEAGAAVGAFLCGHIGSAVRSVMH